MTSEFTIDAGLHLPHQDPTHRLHTLLRQTLGQTNTPALAPPLHAHWDDAFFGLERTTPWADLCAGSRENILSRCARGVLEEAHYIEQCGMAYAARMALEAESVEERMLYSLFGAEETRHLAAIAAWVQPDAPQSPFLDLLARTIETAERSTLFLVIQVVLEGWGLRHYGRLARQCRTPELSRTLEAIVADESRHHASGVVLAAEKPARDEAIAILANFCDLVRVGPVGVAGALHAEVRLGAEASRQAWNDVGGAAHAAERLSLIRSLIEKAGAHHIAAPLHEMGYFTPLPEDTCLEHLA